MREIRRSAIVPYGAAGMRALVEDIESYPEFVPGCEGARILSRDGDEVVACLKVAQNPLRAEFTTRNRTEPAGRITMALEDGPFKSLQGTWDFEPLGDNGCRIGLSLRFEFKSRAKDLLLGPAFEHTCNRLVDAFVARAHAVYGRQSH